MQSSNDHARRTDPEPLVGKIVQDCIQIQHRETEALSIGIYQTPRVEDKAIGKHQRIHDVDDGSNVALPLYDAQMASNWTAPSNKDHPITLDFLVPVKKSTAVSLRVFNVASDSMYKYKVLAGDVNVARPKRTRYGQDYFVAPAQEWVYGTRFANDPCVVRQFQVLQGNSGLSLASALSKDDSLKYMEIQISSRKGYGFTSTAEPQAQTTGFGLRLSRFYLSPIIVQDMHSHDLVHDLKKKLQSQEGIPPQWQRISLTGEELEDEYSLEWYGISGTTSDLHYYVEARTSPEEACVIQQPQFKKRVPSACVPVASAQFKSQIRNAMDICSGGLVSQKFTLDDDPKRWNVCCEVTLRIHPIDEKLFERVTGLRRDTSNKAGSQGARAFATSNPAPRRFIQESELSTGLPSVAQLWDQMKRAKARARVSPGTTSTSRQVQLDIEEPEAKRSGGKLAKYLFICGK